MADYQHVIAVHADVARKRKRNRVKTEEPHSDRGGLMDIDQEDVMILLPQFFAPKDVPDNLVWIWSQFLQLTLESLISSWFISIPKRTNWEEYIPQDSDQWESQMLVSSLFDERPVWPKDSVTERLLNKGFIFSDHMLRRLLSRVAYYFSRGPFLRFWIKKGFDPRKDPDSRIYQKIDYRVKPPLHGYCEANSANHADVPPLATGEGAPSTPADSSSFPDHFPSPASPPNSSFPAILTLFEVLGDLAGKLEFGGLAEEGKWSGKLLESARVEARPRWCRTVVNGGKFAP
ncbi:hypothetical protein ACLB2K_043385 [Fragaria x ananassa]